MGGGCVKQCKNKMTINKEFSIDIPKEKKKENKTDNINYEKKDITLINKKENERNEEKKNYPDRNIEIIYYKKEDKIEPEASNRLFVTNSKNFDLNKNQTERISLINMPEIIEDSREEFSFEYNLCDSKLSKSNSFSSSKIIYEIVLEHDSHGQKNILYDEFFKQKLREKLIKSKNQEFKKNFTHLDVLKIPFPDKYENFNDQDLDYAQEKIEKIRKKLKGKLDLVHFQEETTTITLIESFVENAFKENSTGNNFETYDDLSIDYIGINFEKLNKETVKIYFLYASKE